MKLVNCKTGHKGVKKEQKDAERYTARTDDIDLVEKQPLLEVHKEKPMDL